MLEPGRGEPEYSSEKRTEGSLVKMKQRSYVRKRKHICPKISGGKLKAVAGSE